MKIIVSLLMLLVMTFYAAGQKTRVSPMATVSQTLGESTEITVKYSRPGAKGRDIWGDLVPYDKVWRTGANEATIITFSDDVLVEGNELAGGTYALFTIPSKEEWTLIFSKNANQWGAFKYDEKDDALRVKAKPMASGHSEWLQYAFEDLNGTSAMLVLDWEKLRIPVKVETQNKEGEVRTSLKAKVSQTIGRSTEISVIYSRPGVKGRKIWGELVPYNKVWRTGANENTVITFSTDVLVEGEKLPAGSYGLHAIPSENEWAIIINKISNAWGSYDYKESDDVLRVKVKSQSTNSNQEWLLFDFPELIPAADQSIKAATLTLQWEKLIVPVRVEIAGN
jgi:hypothetical protein